MTSPRSGACKTLVSALSESPPPVSGPPHLLAVGLRKCQQRSSGGSYSINASRQYLRFAVGRLWNVGGRQARVQSAFAPNLTTFAHLSVSSAISFPKSVGEPGSAVAPRSANGALILGSVSPSLISSFFMPRLAAPSRVRRTQRTVWYTLSKSARQARLNGRSKSELELLDNSSIASFRRSMLGFSKISRSPLITASAS
jgi:hypothetical protein